MNNDTLIKELRDKGYGYKTIASDLNISIGSVRNVLKEKDDSMSCRFCNKKLNFVEGKKKKVFCNDSCRYQYWNSLKKVSK
jgi:orotate phosphoribosyltransferase-like protein